ncbi:MAG: lipocalin family protein [Reichenbachiella sp.]
MKNSALLLCFGILFFLSACQSSKEKTNSVVGEWNVQWITYPEKGAAPDPSINLTMNGKMNIKSDGKITVHAYGYEGCIFGTDTLEHTLNWSLSGDTLNLTNDGDEFGIPYIIKESSSDKMKLQLVEDVFLFLTK